MEGHIYKVVKNDSRIEPYIAVVLKEGETEPFTLLRRLTREFLVGDIAETIPELRLVSGEEFDAEVERRKERE